MYLSLAVFERTAEAPVPHNLKGQVFIDGQVNQSAFISVSWKVGILLYIHKKLYALGSLPHTRVTFASLNLYSYKQVTLCMHVCVYTCMSVRMSVFAHACVLY